MKHSGSYCLDKLPGQWWIEAYTKLIAFVEQKPQEQSTFSAAELLSEAAVEIENLDGPENVVAKRLRAHMRTMR